MVRVLIVDDHKLVAQGLAAMVGDEPDMEVVGVCHSVAEAREILGSVRPDVAVVDWRLPDGDGVALGREIRAAVPDCSLVLVTASPEHAAVSGALEAGFSGMVLKTSDPDELLGAIAASARDEAAFSPEVLTALVRTQMSPERRVDKLTEREVEVLQLIADGRGNGEIATELHLSQHTVRNHIRNVLAKLEAHTKLEAVVLAIRAGAIRVDT